MSTNFKRIMSAFLAGTMLCALTACGGSSAGSSGGSSAPAASGASDSDVPTWTIGYANRDDKDTYLKEVMDEFLALCDADSTINVISADAEGDSQQQLDQLDNFNIQGVDAVVLVPQDGETVVDYVNDWNAEGIPVFCSSQASSGGDFTFVGASDYGMGLEKCKWAHDHLPEGAKILYLGGNLGYQTSIDRRQALVDGLAERLYADWDGNVLNPDGDITVLSWQECMYTMEEGLSITEDWIQTFSDFDAILSVNDRSALGAIEALQGANIDDCMVISIDGLPDALQAIKDGTMSATVLQSAKVQAQALYDAVKTAQAGGTNPAVINPEVFVIDSTNVDEYL